MLTICCTDSPTNNPNKQAKPAKIVVYDTVPKKINKGEQLLLEARNELTKQKNTKSVLIERSESEKLITALVELQATDKLNEKQIQMFLKINPSDLDLENTAELSQVYNETLFDVIQKNNKLFASQLIKQPQHATNLSNVLKQPVSDNIPKEKILHQTRKEYQNMIDSRIKELPKEKENLIMQYYIEKKKMIKQLNGKESEITTPEKVKAVNKNKLNKYEKDYKLENRILDKKMDLSVPPKKSEQKKVDQIQLNNLDINLKKLQLEEKLDKQQIRQKVKQLKDN